jgi:hypothetical protein
VAAEAGIFDVIDNLAFFEFEDAPYLMKTRRERWKMKQHQQPTRGKFI